MSSASAAERVPSMFSIGRVPVAAAAVEALHRELADRPSSHGVLPDAASHSLWSGGCLPRAVSRALVFIQAHSAEDIALKDIASAAHVSPYHLARLFKRTIGVAPHQYLIRERLRAARALLSAGGRRSLADIAAAVGFADQSHLARHFKRAFGMTPRDRRQKTQDRALRPAGPLPCVQGQPD
jgi:transcriptional regulator GlxA family with amidase domain